MQKTLVIINLGRSKNSQKAALEQNRRKWLILSFTDLWSRSGGLGHFRLTQHSLVVKTAQSMGLVENKVP